MEQEPKWVIKKESDKPILDRLGSYLAAFGNHEAKCLTLLGFSNTQEAVGKDRLTERVKKMTNNAWEIYPGSVENYCRGSFCKIGLVTIETDGYMLTEEGLAMGQPIAAYLLLEAHKYITSLYDLFGATQSTTDNRSPQNSFAVLNAVVEAGFLTRQQIADKTGIDPLTVSGNLKRLRDHGVVEYKRGSADDHGFAKYSLRSEHIGTEPRSVGGEASLTRAVWGVLKEQMGKELSFYDVECCIRNDPKLSLKYAHSKSFAKRVSNILGGIHKQGLLDHSHIGKDTRSWVLLSDEIKPFVEEVFPKLTAFMEGNPTVIREFNHAKVRVLDENEEAKKIREEAMEKARKKSPCSPDNIESMAIHTQVVKDYLLQHPDARLYEIASMLGKSEKIAQKVLDELAKGEDKLKRTRVGRATIYRIGD